jgi:hypothetical protein
VHKAVFKQCSITTVNRTEANRPVTETVVFEAQLDTDVLQAAKHRLPVSTNVKPPNLICNSCS